MTIRDMQSKSSSPIPSRRPLELDQGIEDDAYLSRRKYKENKKKTKRVFRALDRPPGSRLSRAHPQAVVGTGGGGAHSLCDKILLSLPILLQVVLLGDPPSGLSFMGFVHSLGSDSFASIQLGPFAVRGPFFDPVSTLVPILRPRERGGGRREILKNNEMTVRTWTATATIVEAGLDRRNHRPHRTTQNRPQPN